MKKLFEVGTIVLILLSITGCLQSNTVIKVKPDGSGTIEETFLMNKEITQQMRAMFEQMSQMMGAEEKKGKSKKKQTGGFEIFDEKELKKKAGEKGEGVTYLSGKKVETDRFEGYKAIYSFKDISKLRLNQNPGENVPSVKKEKESEEKRELVMFSFTKGNPSRLIVKLPEGKFAKTPEPAGNDSKKEQTDEQAERAMAEMREVFKDMKISLSVEVQGSIVETNATHREGSRITLMEMDFGKLIEIPEKFRKFSQSNPQTLEDAKKLMQDIPGIKAELNREVAIEFK